MRLLLLLTVVPLTLMSFAHATPDDPPQPPPVRAGTESAIELRAPQERDSFSFVLFGDRTTGNRAGLGVLREAVTMANRLDPDFVMTIGDLIQGSKDPRQWVAQMNEYMAAVEDLRSPWYPCAGNHDVYWNRENLSLFRTHFGPLYYSFDHRWAHFVVLFSDERQSKSDQNTSAEQIAWLKEDLKQTDADQVFVFLHQPRWRYENTNWPEVHDLLNRDGRVGAIFAGHFHTWRDDGLKDGIHHYVVAATGGSLGKLRESAQIQQICHVRVRREGFSLGVIPVGQLHGGDMVLGAEVDAMNQVGKASWAQVEGAVSLHQTETVQSTLRIRLKNPTALGLDWRVSFEDRPGFEFRVIRESGHLEPEDEQVLTVMCTASHYSGDRPDVGAVFTLDYPLQSGLRQPLNQRVALPLSFQAAADTVASGSNRILRLDGQSCVKVPLDHRFEQFTLECWVRGGVPKGWSGLVSKTQQSGFSLNWADPQPDANVRLRGRKKYVNVKTKKPWKWDSWNHLAFTWDGEVARIWRNGRLENEKEAEGELHDNRHPLFIGADTTGRGNPEHLFLGEIDEVRISDVVRYRRTFRPAIAHEPDEDTVLLFHFDRQLDGVILDSSGNNRHGWPLGAPEFPEVKRP